MMERFVAATGMNLHNLDINGHFWRIRDKEKGKNASGQVYWQIIVGIKILH